MNKDKDIPNLVDLKVCDDKFYCQYDIKTLEGVCQQINYSTKQYLGGKCNTLDDCINKADICDNGICSKKNVNPCTDNEDCPIGNFCQTNGNSTSCVPQLKSGEKCSLFTDCVNTAGCLGGVCVDYFSLAEGINVESDSNQKFCSTGFSLNNACANGTLVSNQNCTETGVCSYLSNSTVVNSTSACVCGKNYQGTKYCRYGVNDTHFLANFNAEKALVNSNVSCHTEERFVPCVSTAFNAMDTKTHNDFDFKKSFKQHHNNYLLNNVEFSGVALNDTCVLPALGYDRSIVQPLSKIACPKYSCSKGASSCASSFNPNNWNSTGITVTLSEGVCSSTQSCSLDNLVDVYEKESVSFKCDSKSKTKNRFPGEKCSNNTDCINGNCTNNVCQHVGLGEACDLLDFNKFCGIDSYCFLNTTLNNSSCVTQKGLNENCVFSHECKNNLACYNKTCSLEVGSKDETFEFDPKLFSSDLINNQKFYCQSLLYDEDKNRCYTYTYNGTFNKTDGFYKCEINNGNECEYNTNLNGTLRKNCQCGFNANGNSYCPIDFGTRKYNSI